MSAKSEIRTALESVMSEGEAAACYIGKGYHYNGATEETGWHYIPFNGQAVTLGDNLTEALETIDQMKEEADVMASWYDR